MAIKKWKSNKNYGEKHQGKKPCIKDLNGNEINVNDGNTMFKYAL